jgi:hypothetical protein
LPGGRRPSGSLQKVSGHPSSFSGLGLAQGKFHFEARIKNSDHRHRRPTARAPRSGHATAAPPSVAENFSASDVARCDPPVGGAFIQWGKIPRFQPLRVRGGREQIFSGLPPKAGLPILELRLRLARMPPSPPRALAHSRVSVCDLRDGRRRALSPSLR